ncbi:MAG: hypothetical protein IJ309_03190 [Clostridia bacterium]|nr:hypothetical protein [Clostridia bacterium]
MNKRKRLSLNIVTALLLVVSCLCMFSFYKMLSGFVANGFRYPLLMAPMVFTYLLIPCMFLAFFYDTYVSRIRRGVRLGMACVFGGLSLLCLVGTIVSLDVYASNFSLGVYSSMATVGFPVDGFVINILVALLVVLGLVATLKPQGAIGRIHEGLDLCGTVEISRRRYLALLPFTIFALAFFGDGVCGFYAIENALYDPKYIFLMLWVGLMPILNILEIVLKPERLVCCKKRKIGFLAGGVSINVVFLALALIFELSSPDFMVHVGKPFFIIAFSVSFPVEVLIITATMITGTAVMVSRLIKAVKEK